MRAPQGPPIWDVVMTHIAKKKVVAPQEAAGMCAWWASENFCPNICKYMHNWHVRAKGGRHEDWQRANSRLAPRFPAQRRLRGGAAAIGGERDAGPQTGNPANQPPNVPDWSRSLGDGVAVRAYGKPSSFEAHVIRRDVEWLTASRESSVSFTPLHALDGIITPNGLCFERHHSGIAEIDPADYRLIAAWPGRQAADLHARRYQAHAARQPPIFLRMRGEFRNGMARRAAQWLPVHARHGALRDVYRRAAKDPAQRSRREAECQMAVAGRRRLRRDDALAAAAEGARRRAHRLSHEWRDALSGKRLSGARSCCRAGKPICG